MTKKRNMQSYYSTVDYFAASNENRFTRNFEELITERGDENYITNSSYKVVQNKINSISESTLVLVTQEETQQIYEKYNLQEGIQNINRIKREIISVYNRKLEIDAKIKSSKELYLSFCENIKNCIHQIEYMDRSSEFKEMLEKKMEEYYIFLNLHIDVKEQQNIYKEFEVMKDITGIISQIHCSAVCSVCLENQVSYFVDPCGHTLCAECRLKCELSSQTCHMCRTKRKKYLPLFF
jgi:hypothetical protein